MSLTQRERETVYNKLCQRLRFWWTETITIQLFGYTYHVYRPTSGGSKKLKRTEVEDSLSALSSFIANAQNKLPFTHKKAAFWKKFWAPFESVTAMYTGFSNHIVVIMLTPTSATHEENSTDAQNPHHTCPRKWFVFVAWWMPASRKSLISVLELKSSFGPCPWRLKSLSLSLYLLTSLHCTDERIFYSHLQQSTLRYKHLNCMELNDHVSATQLRMFQDWTYR